MLNIQDFGSENSKFLSFEEFNQRYYMLAYFLNCFQILASIPPNLKSNRQAKGLSVTRDGPKICSLRREVGQISRVTRNRIL